MSILVATAVGRQAVLRNRLALRPWWAFALLAVPIAAALAVYGRGLWFFLDEWIFIADRQLTVADLMRPHNEHWSAVLVIAYRGLVDTFGTSSYAPFHVALIVAHVFAASGVLALLLGVTTRGVALALTTLFLMFGAGSDNLLWAFQIGFALATGLGAWALAVAPRRPALAALLLTLAVATQGVGLFYLAATVMRLHRFRSVLWLAIPGWVYLAWFILAGDGGHPGSLIDSTSFFLYGLLASAGSLFAGGPVIGALLVGLAVIAWRVGTLTIWSAAAIVGLFTGFGLIALARGGDVDLSLAAAPRYLYACVPFVLVVAAETWATVSRRTSVCNLGPVLLAVALVLNVTALIHARAQWDRQLAGEAHVQSQDYSRAPAQNR